MEVVRKSQAQWEGDVSFGAGKLDFGSGAFSGAYSFKDRVEQSTATNPEELIAAAHAGCFSMALSAELGKHGLSGIKIKTDATVTLAKTSEGFSISGIHLDTQVEAEGADTGKLQEIAVFAKKNCPVSRALAATPISLTVNGVPC